MIINFSVTQQADAISTFTFEASLMVEDVVEAREQGYQFMTLMKALMEGSGDWGGENDPEASA